MSQYEYLSYREFSNDEYTKVVITIRENLFDEKGKPKPKLLNFGRKEMKNGGVFYGNMSQGVKKDDGQKEYFKGCEPELKSDSLQLDAFIESIAKCKGDPAVVSVQSKVADVPFIQREVANEQPLPF